MTDQFTMTETCSLPIDHSLYNVLSSIWQILYDAQQYSQRPEVISAQRKRKQEILRLQGLL